ncbi:hypothetical protein ACFVHW_04305 [Streptomyces sp. NPDC127110]|uniref:hypothetical protein n=1 Tax=Streptomyces sp. NPDC127110 TaxID=3345362 RepID=UPI003645EED8
MTLGRLEGQGATLTAAKTALAVQLTAAADGVGHAPAFFRDGCALVVGIDRPWGTDVYRAIGNTARTLRTYGRHPEGPAAALAAIPGYTPMRKYTSSRDEAPRPQLHTREEVAEAITEAREIAETFAGVENALDILTQGVLSRLANPLAQCPPPDPSVTKENGHKVTVRAVSNGYVSEYSQLPGRTFGPWPKAEMIRDLTVSALLDHTAARELVMGAADNGTATANTKR